MRIATLIGVASLAGAIFAGPAMASGPDGHKKAPPKPKQVQKQQPRREDRRQDRRIERRDDRREDRRQDRREDRPR